VCAHTTAMFPILQKIVYEKTGTDLSEENGRMLAIPFCMLALEMYDTETLKSLKSYDWIPYDLSLSLLYIKKYRKLIDLRLRVLDFQKTDRIYEFMTQRVKTVDRLRKSLQSIVLEVVPGVITNLKLVCEIMNELYMVNLAPDWTVETLYISFYEEDAILLQWCHNFYCWICKDYVEISLMSYELEINEIRTDFEKEIQSGPTETPPEYRDEIKESLLRCITAVNGILNKK